MLDSIHEILIDLLSKLHSYHARISNKLRKLYQNFHNSFLAQNSLWLQVGWELTVDGFYFGLCLNKAAFR